MCICWTPSRDCPIVGNGMSQCWESRYWDFFYPNVEIPYEIPYIGCECQRKVIIREFVVLKAIWNHKTILRKFAKNNDKRSICGLKEGDHS